MTIILAIDRLLHRYDHRYRRKIAVILLLAAIMTVLVVLRPLPIKFLIEQPVPGTWLGDLKQSLGEPTTLLLAFGGMLVLLEVLILGFRIANELLSTWLSEFYIRRFRADVASNLIQGPYEAVTKIGVGKVLAAIVGDVEVIQRLIKDVVVQALLAAFQLVLMISIVFLLQPTLAIILIVEILLLAILIQVYANWRKHAFLRQMENQAQYLGWVSNLYQQNLDLRFSQSRHLFLARTIGWARRMHGLALILWSRQTAYFAFVEFFVGIASAVCLVYLFLQSGSEGRPLGDLLVFLYYTVLVFPCLSKVGEAVPLLTDAQNAYNRLVPLLGIKDLKDRQSGRYPQFGEIEFRNVGFQGEQGEWIMRGISLTIRPGDHVAISGDSGAGKSTLLGMLLGLVKPAEGEVLINGVLIDHLTLADRKRFFTFQRSLAPYFQGTLGENIALGRAWSPDEVLPRARLAARVAGSELGLEQPIDDRGAPFSQGERQRIAIARCFLAATPALILDEALNSLDEESEHAILGALFEAWRGRTMIVISHRRSVAETAPLLIDLKRGKGITITERPRPSPFGPARAGEGPQ
ncbi:MAG: ABC transporter ATP-binding protein [Alphaproteobacteria bacterium]|nr:ABC transporter ATP-binding protein [Alphaproteobacteria bacterium]